MNTDFPRILTLLRKEKGMSQKNVSSRLQISQALLSHYEKGIRECGLDFLVRCADFYGVSCDYLLGRSPDRQGSTITLEDIPESDGDRKENRSMAGMLPVLNKKLIINSLNILFDLLTKVGDRALTSEVSSYLGLALYRMFRVVYSSNPKNQEAMFGVPAHVCAQYTNAAMQISEANAQSAAHGNPIIADGGKKSTGSIVVSTQTLEDDYPLHAPSLLNLIQSAEQKIGFKDKVRKKPMRSSNS